MTRQRVLLAAIAAVLMGASLAGAPPVSARSQVARTTTTDVAALRPTIVQRLIKFGPTRKRQMAAYSYRHYGHRLWRLRHPHVIVEHYTDGGTFQSAWATMAANTRNLGEKPGVCAHFVIDTDGTIYQVVPMRIRCRHTIGLNQTSIGIEHVGTSSKRVLDNRKQRHASIRLTLWLMARFHISAGNVIGHGESLMSPYRHERYRSWKCMTHVDFSHPAMVRYRSLLRARAKARGVPIGPPPHWVDIGC